jgi:hypothetical protein
MEAHAAAMKATNQTTQFSLAKITRKSKIVLMVDMTAMDPLERARHEMYRERISKEVLAAQAAAAASVTASAPTTFMLPPAPVESVPAMEVPQEIANEEDVGKLSHQ